MNWAWRQTLTPTLKLVLMALADSADDQGVCWPSVST
ncbi:MAG: helix-turn-helix domain-containing protein, partial [Sedimenticolaceae bacterium]